MTAQATLQCLPVNYPKPITASQETSWSSDISVFHADGPLSLRRGPPQSSWKLTKADIFLLFLNVLSNKYTIQNDLKY